MSHGDVFKCLGYSLEIQIPLAAGLASPSFTAYYELNYRYH